MFNLYLYLHSSPYLCVCVVMIGWFIIREQMIWQVSQETL